MIDTIGMSSSKIDIPGDVCTCFPWATERFRGSYTYSPKEFIFFYTIVEIIRKQILWHRTRPKSLLLLTLGKYVGSSLT